MLGFPDHAAIGCFVEQWLKICPKLTGNMLCLFSVQQKLLHVVQFPLRPMIIDLQILGLDIQDQDQLLSVVVKGDDFVEQHQVHILEAFLVLRIQPQGRFAVFDIVIGKISYQSSGKGRQPRKLGTFILFHDVPDDPSDISGIRPAGQFRFYCGLTVIAGDLKQWIIA